MQNKAKKSQKKEIRLAFVVHLGVFDVSSLVLAQDQFGGRSETHRLNEKLINTSSVLVDDQIEILLDQLIKTEVSPVHNQFGQQLSQVFVEVLKGDWPVYGVNHDLIHLSSRIYMRPSQLVDLATGLVQLQGIEHTLGHIVQIDWLS